MEFLDQPDDKDNRAPNLLLRSRHEFSTLEKRMFYLVIDDLNPNLETSEDLFSGNRVVKIHNARKALGNPNYKALLDACDEITAKRIRYIDKKNKEYDSITPFPRVRYKEGTLTITILQDVLPSFTDLNKNGYTRYKLNAALSLSRESSQRMYDIISGWKIKGESYVEWVIDIDRLKIWLNVDKIETYQNYAQFTRGVLEPAKKELLKKTEIIFDYEVHEKKSRKVTSLKFMVKYTELGRKNISPKDISNELSDLRIQNAYKNLDELGIMREELRSEIVTNHLTEFGKWMYAYKTNQFKIKTSASGHLLTTLGLA